MEKKNRKLWVSIPITEAENQLIKDIQLQLKETTFQDIPKGRIARALAVAGLNHVNPEFAVEDPTLVFQLEAMGVQYPCV